MVPKRVLATRRVGIAQSLDKVDHHDAPLDGNHEPASAFHDQEIRSTRYPAQVVLDLRHTDFATFSSSSSGRRRGKCEPKRRALLEGQLPFRSFTQQRAILWIEYSFLKRTPGFHGLDCKSPDTVLSGKSRQPG